MPKKTQNFNIIHTKEFTSAQISLFKKVMTESLNDAKIDTPQGQWLGLEYELVVRCALLYKYYKKHKVVYLISLATDPVHRRQGFASNLLEFFLENINQMTHKEVWFFCDKERIPFYKNRGAIMMKKKQFRRVIKDSIGSNCVCMKFP